MRSATVIMHVERSTRINLAIGILELELMTKRN